MVSDADKLPICSNIRKYKLWWLMNEQIVGDVSLGFLIEQWAKYIYSLRVKWFSTGWLPACRISLSASWRPSAGTIMQVIQQKVMLYVVTYVTILNSGKFAGTVWEMIQGFLNFIGRW